MIEEDFFPLDLMKLYFDINLYKRNESLGN